MEEVSLRVKGITLSGNYFHSEGAASCVIFSHGSGSSRMSPRNRYVAEVLSRHGHDSFLFDLLTLEEDELVENRFDIAHLSERLSGITEILMAQPQFSGFKWGYFGSSTGAASAICAAAKPGSGIKAIVSRGGRPDLAGADLEKIDVPVLLLVGGFDADVIELNRKARERISCISRLIIVPGATHLFEEAGKLDDVARLASDWFDRYLK